jgi:hypothetical protein
MCRVYIKVRIKFKLSECLLLYFLNSLYLIIYNRNWRTALIWLKAFCKSGHKYSHSIKWRFFWIYKYLWGFKHNLPYPRVIEYICYKYVVCEMPYILQWVDIVYFKLLCLRRHLLQYRNCEHYLSKMSEESRHATVSGVSNYYACQTRDTWRNVI